MEQPTKEIEDKMVCWMCVQLLTEPFVHLSLVSMIKIRWLHFLKARDITLISPFVRIISSFVGMFTNFACQIYFYKKYYNDESKEVSIVSFTWLLYINWKNIWSFMFLIRFLLVSSYFVHVAFYHHILYPIGLLY